MMRYFIYQLPRFELLLDRDPEEELLEELREEPEELLEEPEEFFAELYP